MPSRLAAAGVLNSLLITVTAPFAGIDLDDAVLEPERAVDHAVGADLEAVEAAQVLRDQARRLGAGDVELPQRIAEEDLGRVELAVAAVEVERVEARQVLREHAHRRAVVLAVAHHAHQVVGPRHLAVRADGDVVGLALGPVDEHLRRAARAVDLPDRVADDAAGEQAPALVDRQAVHAGEARRRDDDLGRVPARRPRRRCRRAGRERQRGSGDEAAPGSSHGGLLCGRGRRNPTPRLRARGQRGDQPATRLQPELAFERGVARVAAQRIEARIDAEIGDPARARSDGVAQAGERGVGVAERGVDHRRLVGEAVLAVGGGVELAQHALRLARVARRGIGVAEAGAHHGVALRQRARVAQRVDRVLAAAAHRARHAAEERRPVVGLVEVRGAVGLLDRRVGIAREPVVPGEVDVDDDVERLQRERALARASASSKRRWRPAGARASGARARSRGRARARARTALRPRPSATRSARSRRRATCARRRSTGRARARAAPRRAPSGTPRRSAAPPLPTSRACCRRRRARRARARSRARAGPRPRGRRAPSSTRAAAASSGSARAGRRRARADRRAARPPAGRARRSSRRCCCASHSCQASPTSCRWTPGSSSRAGARRGDADGPARSASTRSHCSRAGIDGEGVAAVADDDAVAEHAAQERERLAQVGRRRAGAWSGQNIAISRSRVQLPCIDSTARTTSRQSRRGCASKASIGLPSPSRTSMPPTTRRRITPGSRSFADHHARRRLARRLEPTRRPHDTVALPDLPPTLANDSRSRIVATCAAAGGR